MKIKLDTQIKTITIEESVNLGELISLLENLLPDGLWKEFKLETNVINNWTNPIVIPYTPIYPTNPNPFPLQPSWPINPYPQNPNYPWITFCQNTDTNDSKVTFNSGVYNVECHTR